MERVRTRPLIRSIAGGVFATGLLAAGAGSAQAGSAASTVAVPCRVSALAAAMSSFNAGDTLSLAPDCVYHLTQAPPVVSQDLIIAGNGAMLERSYDPGTPAFTILSISAAAVTINNLEIRNGDNGVTVSGPSAAITVNDSVFVNNHGTEGGAISSADVVSGPVVSDSVFIDNKATDAGGAIYDNSGDDGVTVSGSTFTGNVAAGDGGGIYDFSARGEQLTGSVLQGNSASEGGGIWFSPAGGMLISQDTISGNDVTADGGGIAAIDFNSMQLKDSTISGNHAGDGGGIYIRQGNFVTMTDTDIAANVAHDGGGLFNKLIGNDETLSGTKFVNNHASADGGGIYNDNGVNGDNGLNWSAANMQIIGNIAGSAGGGIFNNGPAAATLTTSLVNANKPTNCAPAGSVAGCSG